ncbi:ADP-ribosylglycohydrolase family protein [Streptomyces bobili]|uniref:ADP-ribosylglycohydrolase family protein n=1 Tax=Streptomyces bobili TaxID=67280 RepID=UPI0036FF14CC
MHTVDEEHHLFAGHLGQDADTVGAVTGALAGARYGEQAIPSTAGLHVPLPGFGDRVLDTEDLCGLAGRLAAAGTRRPSGA